MDSGTSCPASLSDATLLRESSEVGAVCVNAHVRICAGGGLRRPSLPRRRTELVWKHDIRLGCKGLRLKAKHADQIHYVHLGKMYVVKASTKNKALRDFRSEPQWPVRTPTLQPRLGVCRGRRRYKRPDSHPIRGRVSGSGGSNRRKETAMRLFTPVR